MNKLQKYFDDIYIDIPSAAENDLIFGDPLVWWQRVGRTRYPTLFKIALNYLAIPATLYECERCFSKAKRTIIINRNALSASIIKALQLQRNWLLNKVVDSELNKLSAHIARQKDQSEDVAE